MNSCLYAGHLVHARVHPRKHAFRYSTTLFCVDLDELPELPATFPEIAGEGVSLFNFRESDHLPSDSNKRCLKKRAVDCALSYDPNLRVEKVLMITRPRMMGYVFNPASFFYFLDRRGDVAAAMIEVHNTFGETKNYFVPSSPGGRLATTRSKHFYVSPFSELDNELSIKMTPPLERVKVVVNVKKEGTFVFFSHFQGRRRELNRLRLWKLFFTRLLSTYLVPLRIHGHALLLWIKRVPYFRKNDQPELQRDLSLRFPKRTKKEKKG